MCCIALSIIEKCSYEDLNLHAFLIHDNVHVYNYYSNDFILDFGNGLYRAHTFYERVTRHEWIFKFAAIKHLNVHTKVKQKKQNCIPISENFHKIFMENISYFMST